MQSHSPWATENGPGTFPRIPLGYSYTQPQPFPTDDFLCPHCQSPWSNEALLLSHIRAVHQQNSAPSGVALKRRISAEDPGNAFLLEDNEEEGEEDDLDPVEPEVNDKVAISNESIEKATPTPDRLNSVESETPSLSSSHDAGTGFPCNQCPGVVFRTKRELDVHTSVIHAFAASEPVAPPTAPEHTEGKQTDANHVDNLPTLDHAESTSASGVPSGFRGSPIVSDAEPLQAAPTHPLDELACQWCPPHKRSQPFPSKEVLYAHLQEMHLRCPATLLGAICAVGSFPSRDLLCKHIQAVHLLCPDCTHPIFRSRAAVHKHIQLSHGRCSHCSKGSYASPKALADHIRAAHTSQHIRARPRTENKVQQGAAPPSGLQLGALHYVLDSDGLEYMAHLICTEDDGKARIQWIGFDCECLVPATSVLAAVELQVGSFAMVNLGREDEDLEQGELVEVDAILGQYSVRLLSSDATYGIGVEHLLDVIQLRTKLPCMVNDESGTPRLAEIVSFDTPTRRCTIRWTSAPKSTKSSAKKGAIAHISFDELRSLIDLRKGFFCAVAEEGGGVYEAQLLEVIWAQSQCKVYRFDTHQETTIPISNVLESWRGDHVLDEKMLVPATAGSLSGMFPENFEVPAPKEDSPIADAIYKPAMRFPAALPDDKSKLKKDIKKKKDEKVTERPTTTEVPAQNVANSVSSSTAVTPVAPYPTAAPTPAASYPPNGGAPPPPPPPPPEAYDYAAAYAASAGYPDSYLAGFYTQGYAGYPGAYAYGGAYPATSAYPAAYTDVPSSPSDATYGFFGMKGLVGQGRGEGRRQSRGEGQRAGRSKGKGQRTGRFEDYGQSRSESQGWSTTGPQPHRMLFGRPYHEAVFQMALEEQQSTPPVMPPRVPPLPRNPYSRTIGDWALRFAKAVAPSQEDISNRSVVRAAAEKILRQSMDNRNLQLYCYGSSSSGLLSKNSELDLCLIWDANYNCNMAPFRVKALLRQAAAALKAGGMQGSITAQLEERFPCVRRTGADLNFEISMSHYCGVRNSALIKQYVLGYPIVRPLVMVIVAWAKRAGVHNRHDGLHSYTLTLMVLYYLIRVGDIQYINIEQPLQMSKEPCSFFAFHEPMDTTKLGSHLLGFFHFYSVAFDYAKHAVSIRTPFVVTRESKRWMHEPFAVEDPFETFINTAQPITTAKWGPIKQAIDHAYSLLLEAKMNEFLPESTAYLSYQAGVSGRFSSPFGQYPQPYQYTSGGMARQSSLAYGGAYPTSAPPSSYSNSGNPYTPGMNYGAYATPSAAHHYPYNMSYNLGVAAQPGANPYDSSGYAYPGSDFTTSASAGYTASSASYLGMGYTATNGVYNAGRSPFQSGAAPYGTSGTTKARSPMPPIMPNNP